MCHILVCVKAVPDLNDVQIDDSGKFHRSTTNLQWNIADLSAVEAALSLKDIGGTVTVLTMGPAKLEAPLKELLARGADRAVLISDPALVGSDTYATAKVLATAVQKLGHFDLILCGNQSVDGETGQVPPMLAAALNMPCITNAEQLTLNANQICLERILEDGMAKLSVELPCVVSIRPYAYTLRLPGIFALRKAQKTPVHCFGIQDLGLTPDICGVFGSLTKVSAIEKQFHSRRNGPKETNPDTGCAQIIRYLQEVK